RSAQCCIGFLGWCALQTPALYTHIYIGGYRCLRAKAENFFRNLWLRPSGLSGL
ncbi:hypothetical protein T492DRAFT_905665, partial [Pavlovales sp. CCMP2436]